VVHRIPHGAGRVPLVLGHRELGRGEAKPGLVAALTLQLPSLYSLLTGKVISLAPSVAVAEGEELEGAGGEGEVTDAGGESVKVPRVRLSSGRYPNSARPVSSCGGAS